MYYGFFEGFIDTIATNELSSTHDRKIMPNRMVLKRHQSPRGLFVLVYYGFCLRSYLAPNTGTQALFALATTLESTKKKIESLVRKKK